MCGNKTNKYDLPSFGICQLYLSFVTNDHTCLTALNGLTTGLPDHNAEKVCENKTLIITVLHGLEPQQTAVTLHSCYSHGILSSIIKSCFCS